MIELCRHIKPEGTACKGPTVRGTNFCRHHQLIKNTLDKVKPSIENNALFKPLPFHFPEDRSAIQTNLFLVINAFNRRRIDSKAASVMIYGLQVCLSNLNKGPLAPTDAEDTVRRVILTLDGDEIAPPRELLEKDESPIHHKDCPCQRCAEQFRGAAPEQHHADCKCGVCEPITNEVSSRPKCGVCEPITNELSSRPKSVQADEVEGPAFRESSAGAPHLAEMWDRALVLSNAKEPVVVFGCHPERSEGPAVREAHAKKLVSADTLSPLQKEPNYHHYLYGDEIAKHEAQYAARARAALAAGLEPPEHTLFDPSTQETESDRRSKERRAEINQRRKESVDKWNAEHPDQPREFKPYLTWGEEEDLRRADLKKIREEEEARLRQQSQATSLAMQSKT